MLSASAVISGASKRIPLDSQYNKSSIGQLGPLSTSSHLSSSAKKKPSVAKSFSRNFNRLTPSLLRAKLSSRSAIIMDSYTGQVLYAHEPDRTAQPASTIKILTGLIAMKSLRDSVKVEVSRKASKMPRSKIYLHQGRKYKANDLINAVLLSSANDASVALAEKVAGSEHTFVKLMNHKARQLGARSTVCKSASGLTVRGQRSTVRDLATIFNGAMQDEEFASRIGKVRARTSYGRLLKNHNRALWRIDGAMGGKTGYTHSARQTYVGMFERDGNAITVSIMGSETMWDDVSNLVEYGFARQSQLAAAGKISKKPAMVASLPLLSSSQGSGADDKVKSSTVLSQISKHRKM
ncbi:MAG: serine hydrolase [Thermodesulfobacteriota bacterium]